MCVCVCVCVSGGRIGGQDRWGHLQITAQGCAASMSAVDPFPRSVCVCVCVCVCVYVCVCVSGGRIGGQDRWGHLQITAQGCAASRSAVDPFPRRK